MDIMILKMGKKYSFVKGSDINWIESNKGILKIHVDKKYYIVKISLQELKSKLSSDDFIQISRSKIITFTKSRSWLQLKVQMISMSY